jgi:SAM-dependent methyltransferase
LTGKEPTLSSAPHTSIDSSPLRDFFNQKAGGWGRKYAPSGPLAHRLQLFAEQLDLLVPAPARVLEVGCGTGNLAAHLASRGYALTACDIAEEMLAEAQRTFASAGIDWRLVHRGQRLPLEDASFDAVVASSVFEYVDDIPFALAECRRVLRPGGMLLATVPTDRHWHRRLEAALLPPAFLMRSTPVRWPSRLQGYVDYLFLSRNRLSIAEWEALAVKARLHSVGAPDRQAGTLTLLTFRRDT